MTAGTAWRPLDAGGGLMGLRRAPLPLAPPPRAATPSTPLPQAQATQGPATAPQRPPSKRPPQPSQVKVRGGALWTRQAAILNPDSARGRIIAAMGALGLDREDLTREEITVRAWRLWPEDFGLQGFERHHPDMMRVAPRLTTRDPLSTLGLMRCDDVVGRYRLTERGRKWWRWCGSVILTEAKARATRAKGDE